MSDEAEVHSATVAGSDQEVASVSEPEPSRLKGVIGAHVSEWIGGQIGSVVGIEGSYFQVQQPDGARFWLHQDCINTRNGSEVRLIFPKAQLDRYRLDEPGPPD